jgi:hypothetical protein
MPKSYNSYLQIIGVKQMEKAGNGKIFRHITLIDTTNHKTVDYVIFKKDHDKIWSDILEEDLDKIAYPGEIISFMLTKKIMNDIRSLFKLTIKEGDFINIVLWDDDGWDPMDVENRVRNSLQKQIWRFRKLPPKSDNIL